MIPLPSNPDELFRYVAAIANADAERITKKWDAMTPDERLRAMRAEIEEVKKWESAE